MDITSPSWFPPMTFHASSTTLSYIFAACPLITSSIKPNRKWRAGGQAKGGGERQERRGEKTENTQATKPEDKVEHVKEQIQTYRKTAGQGKQRRPMRRNRAINRTISRHPSFFYCLYLCSVTTRVTLLVIPTLDSSQSVVKVISVPVAFHFLVAAFIATASCL